MKNFGHSFLIWRIFQVKFRQHRVSQTNWTLVHKHTLNIASWVHNNETCILKWEIRKVLSTTSLNDILLERFLEHLIVFKSFPYFFRLNVLIYGTPFPFKTSLKTIKLEWVLFTSSIVSLFSMLGFFLKSTTLWTTAFMKSASCPNKNLSKTVVVSFISFE